MAGGGIVRTADAITITLARANSGNITVPDVFAALGQRYSRDFGLAADAAEQA